MYGFALVAPPEGFSICCAIATEETLNNVAKEYKSKGYIAKQGDTFTLLKQVLRWNPADGWHWYLFQEDEGILLELRQAFDSGEIKMFDGTTESICIQALKQLDQAYAFGFGEERENIAISFTYGEDPEDFMDFSEQLNSQRVVQRLKKEVADSYTLDTNIKGPYV